MMTGKLLGRKFPGVKRSIQTGKESVPLFSDGENGRRAAERAQIEMPRTGENSLNLPLHISIPLPSDHMHQNQACFGLHGPLSSRHHFGTRSLFLGLACIQFGIMRCCVCQGPTSSYTLSPPLRPPFPPYLWS